MPGIVETDDAPAAVGAYSQATTTDSLLFTAGQLPLTPEGELLDDESVAVQTERCLENVEAILAAEGAAMTDVLKVSVFLDDIDDFEEMNDTYAEFFSESPPARSAVEVGEVPKGAAVEIEVVAALD
ncbi:reactive intermediate/imine deaminase [Halogranum amylolyticum]|uniref:Reactive intermediate/imine deaminase n=1 Tax=Halogranum amylolyticum TaxID=660520 RepID=A0A1H8SVL9_9EURY|nr:Rid family detoxifying hydrolase [Halogranum amylolyticum]SEO83029.1 reactive intermediate/imine deaminase [Halogranum amylolyticum]